MVLESKRINALVHVVREASQLWYALILKAAATFGSPTTTSIYRPRQSKPATFLDRRSVAVRRILYVQFGDPAAYPPIEHSAHILAERNWDVFLLGTDAYGIQNLRLATHPQILAKNLALAKFAGRQSIQYVYFFCWCLYLIWTWRPTWIYVSDPLALPAIWLVRKFTTARIVYHEHDSPNATPARSWFMKAALMCRKKLAREVELCIIPQQERLIKFLEETKRESPTVCVWNCPRLCETQSNYNNEKSEQDCKLILHYHGSINSERLPKKLVEAASRFKGAIRIRIIGYEVPGSIGYVSTLVKVATESGAPGIIEFLGTIPHQDIFKCTSKADVGLSFMPKQSDDINLRYMVGASNKPFEYMASGLPLLVTDLPEWKSTFVIPGYARACDPDDVDSLEAELNWYLCNPVQRREMGRRCAEQIRQYWNYDTMFGCVLARLERF